MSRALSSRISAATRPAVQASLAASPGADAPSAQGPSTPAPSLRLLQSRLGNRAMSRAMGSSGGITARLLQLSLDQASNQALTRAHRRGEVDFEDRALSNLGRVSGGRPLSSEDRARFNAAFDHDFSHVRVHTEYSDQLAAQALHAHAFALGAHLYFGPGEYQPGTPATDRLLAHELTHVVQHDQGRLPFKTGDSGVSSPSDPTEQEAYANEGRILGRLGSVDSAEALAEPTSEALPSQGAAAVGTSDGQTVSQEAGPQSSLSLLGQLALGLGSQAFDAQAAPSSAPIMAKEGDKDKDTKDLSKADPETRAEEAAKDKTQSETEKTPEEKQRDKERAEEHEKSKDGEDEDESGEAPSEEEEGKEEKEGDKEGEEEGEGEDKTEEEGSEETEEPSTESAEGESEETPSSESSEGETTEGTGEGVAPSPATRTPEEGGLGDLEPAEPDLSEEEIKAIEEQTGRSPAEHMAAIRSRLQGLTERASQAQREAIAYATEKKGQVRTTLEGRKGELEGAITQARTSIEGAYSSARAAVTQAVENGKGNIEGQATQAQGTIDTTAETQRAQLKTDYEAAKKAITDLITEWKPQFVEVYTKSGDDHIQVAKEKSKAFLAQKEAIKLSFVRGGDALNKYIGQVQGDTAAKKVDEASKAMATGGDDQKKKLVAEGNKFDAQMMAHIKPISSKVEAVGAGADQAVDQAKGQATTKLEADKDKAMADMAAISQGATTQLDADEKATKDELDTIETQQQTNLETRIIDTEARIDEMGASLADRYRDFMDQARQALPTDSFVTAEEMENSIASLEAQLVQIGTESRAEVDGALSTAQSELNASIDADLVKIQSAGTDAATEANQIANEKALAVGEVSTGFANSLSAIGASVQQSIQAYAAPVKIDLENHKAQLVAKLGELKTKTQTELETRKGKYAKKLDDQIANYAKTVAPVADAESQNAEKKLEGRAKNAYSAMRGLGTNEDKLFDALRGLKKGEPGALRQVFQNIAGGSLQSWLIDDLDKGELKIANAHLACNHALAARLEIADNMSFWGDDEAQIEKILRGLPEEERKKILSDPAWASTREEMRSNLGGTDLNVVEALMANKVARADAYRLQEKIDKARRKGDHDAVHKALEGVKPEDMGKVAQELAHIQGKVDLDKGGTISEADAKKAMVDYVAKERVVGYNQHTGEAITSKMEGTDKDLTEALIMHGAGSVEEKVARLAKESERKGGPKDENLEKALYTDPKLQDMLHSQDPEKVAEAKKKMAEEREKFEKLYEAKYGKKPQEVIGNIGSDAEKQKMYQQMYKDGFNSPEVAKQQIQIAIKGAGTDEEAIQRALKGMHPEEIKKLKALYPNLEKDLGVNDEAKKQFFTELSGEDRMKVEILLMGDEKYMTDKQKLELAKKKYDWQLGSESTALGRGIMGGSNEKEQLQKHFDKLSAYEKAGKFDKDGKFIGTPEEYDEYRRTCRYVGITAALYQERSDAIANTITSAIAITGAVVAAVVTGGAASPLIAVAVAGAVGAASMGANYAMKGGRYGWESAAKDLGITAVSMATAGVGAGIGGKLAKTAEAAGKTVTVGQKAAIAAGSGFINSSAATAMDDKTWKEGFGKGMNKTLWAGTKGAAVSAASAAASAKFEAWKPGKDLVDSTKYLTRGSGKAISGGLGGLAGGSTDVAMDAMHGDWKGTDALDVLEKVGTETGKGAFQGFLEGVAEVPKARIDEAKAKTEETETTTPKDTDEDPAVVKAKEELETVQQQVDDEATTKLKAADETGAREVDKAKTTATTSDSEETDATVKTKAQNELDGEVLEVKSKTDATKREVVDDAQNKLKDAEQKLEDAVVKATETEGDETTTNKTKGPEEVEETTTTPPKGPGDGEETSSPPPKPPEVDESAALEEALMMKRLEEIESFGGKAVVDAVLSSDDPVGTARILDEYGSLLAKNPHDMSPAEVDIVLKANAIMSAQELETVRKVMTPDDVMAMINQKYSDTPTVGGSVGDARNTEGLTPAEMVQVLGLDYKTDEGQTPYLTGDDPSNYKPVDEVLFIDMPATDALMGEAKVPLDKTFIDAAATSTDPDVQAMVADGKAMELSVTLDETTGKQVTSDPYKGTGGTATGDNLPGGASSINQERKMASRVELPIGTQLKYRGPDGQDVVVATYLGKDVPRQWKMAPDLPPEVAKMFEGKLRQDNTQ